jgi:hypothetical protein
MYGCDVWPLRLREDRRLRIYENRILRRIFRPEGYANGECRSLQDEELHTSYRSPYVVRVIKSRRLRWAGHVAIMEKVGMLLKC